MAISTETRLRWIPKIASHLNILSGRRAGPFSTKGIFFLLVSEALRIGDVKDFEPWLANSKPQVRALGIACMCLRRPPHLEPLIRAAASGRGHREDSPLRLHADRTTAVAARETPAGRSRPLRTSPAGEVVKSRLVT